MSNTSNNRDATRLFRLLLILLTAWLTLKYALPWIFPFLLALATARLIEPAVAGLHRRRGLKRGFAAVLCTLLLTGSTVSLFIMLVSRFISEAERFSVELPQYISAAAERLDMLSAWLGQYLGADGGKAAQTWLQSSGLLTEKLSNALMDAAGQLISSAPDVLLFAVTYLVSLFFMSARYPAIVGFILRQIPEKLHDRFFELKNGLLSAIGHWIRAELTLMLITLAELFLGFTLLKVSYSFSLAAITALIDALPVFGVGIVLLPWALVSLLTGRKTLGIGLVLLYAVITLVRGLLEPRIVGTQLGLDPVATLISVYLGYCVLGFTGMVIFPVLLIVLRCLNSDGVIKLWRV